MGAGYKFVNKAAQDNSAEVFIYEDVGAGWFGGVTAKDFANDLRAAGKVKTIDVRIASYGGDVVEGLAMYRLLADHDARIVVHVDSLAASVASVIAMAGDEIQLAEAGSIMIHNAWTISAGNAEDMRQCAERLEATSKQLAEIYAARTKNGLPKVRDWMAAETWFRGQEAVDAGFADKLAANVQAAAYASPLWHSVMQGRVLQNMNLQRSMKTPADAAAPARDANPHPANEDVRAQIKRQSERMRLRAAKRVTPLPAH